MKSLNLKQVFVFSAAFTLLSVSVLANAASVAYTDVTAFNNALSAAGLTGVTQDFATEAAANGVTDSNSYGVLDPTPISVGLASFAGQDNGLSNGSAGFLAQNSYGIAGAFYTHQLFSENGDNLIQITFASPVKGFGFHNNAFNIFASNSGNWDLTLTTVAGDIEVFHSPLTLDGSVAFSGLISDTAFASVTLAGTAANMQITDFTVAAVPVPAASWLLGSGILGLIGVARRKTV